jgi:hypothetical protein
MKRNSAALSLALSFIFALAQPGVREACAEDAELRGPLGVEGTTVLPNSQAPATPMGGLGAPGSGALMNPDMLLVNPATSNNAQAPPPLKAYIGATLILKAERYDISFDRLRGILINVVNETDRPLVINGEKANAIAGGETVAAAPVTALQKIVIPTKTAQQYMEDIFKKLIPAAATIGAIPAFKDFSKQRKPVLERYGKDEVRRRVESTRFGRRILWPKEQTRGVLYFDTDTDLDGARVEIPVSTLFDTSDAGTLVSTPQVSKSPDAPGTDHGE